MSFLDEFDAWKEKVKQDLNFVYGMMRKPLSDEPSQIIGEIEEVDGWYSRMIYILSEANGFLDRAKEEYLPGKEEGTAFDREVILDASISLIREHRDKIEGLCEAMKQRVSLGQSVLKYSVQFSEPKVTTRK